VSPTLPAGLAYSPTTGQVSGTPTAASPATTYTITVTDQATPTIQTSSKTFSLTVTQVIPALTTTQAVATSSLAVGATATPFTPVTGSGGVGTLRYAVSPALPAGLAFSTSTGQVTGTPTAASPATTYTVTVTDETTPTAQTSSKTFSLTVVQGTQAITTTLAVPIISLAVGIPITPFTPVTGAGGVGTLRYAISPSLPSALSLNTTNGQITGTPTAGSPANNYTITVTDQATPIGQISSKTFSLAVVSDIVPKTGWWWNASESGRGFFIERRGNTMFMAGYLYEADGRASWFISSGPMTTNTFTGDIAVFRNGQTLTGTYKAPSAGTSPGRVTLSFNSDSTATMTWPGGTVSLSRFPFGGGGSGAIESGWWWNADESGRGYSVEIQGDTIFLVGFMYDASGNPVWYSSSGALVNNVFNGVWQEFANGQSLSGTYKVPTVANASVGLLRVQFTGSSTLNMTYPDGRVQAGIRYRF
jgi:Putative Ig domain